MTKPTLLQQLIAERMRNELNSRRLEVVLVPSPPEFWPTERQRRVVVDRNPAWYRQFCRQWPSQRTRPRRKRHGDTRIKRSHTLRALDEIADGKIESEYAQRLWPLVQQKAKEYVDEYDYYHHRNGHRPEHTPPAYPARRDRIGRDAEAGQSQEPELPVWPR